MNRLYRVGISLLFCCCLLFASPAHAAGFGSIGTATVDAAAGALHSILVRIADAVEALNFSPSHVAVAAVPFGRKELTATVGNLAAAATSQTATTTSSTRSTVSYPTSNAGLSSPNAAAIVAGAAKDPANFVTQNSLGVQLNELANSLRSLIYSQESAPGSLPATGGNFNNVALSQIVDNLSNVTLSNATVDGISGLTAADIPQLNYFPATSTVSIAYGGTGTSTPPGANKLLFSDANGNWEYVATSSLGVTADSNYSFSYPLLDSANTVSLAFGTTTPNVWSSLQTLTSGFLSDASSTIGNGAQSGGLTISGGATTTGTAYFANDVGIGTTSPFSMLSVAGQVVAQNFVATSTTATSTFAAPISIGSTNPYTVGDGNWDFGTPVPYFRSNVTNSAGILDVLSNGNGGSSGTEGSWIDVGSDYVTHQPNGEFIMLWKEPSSYGEINVKGLGTGMGRALVLQDTTFTGVGANGGSSAIGFNAPPNPATQYYAEYDQNNGTRFAVTNTSSGTTAYSTLETWNDTSGTGYVRLLALGTGWTTQGGYVQNGGALSTGPDLTGGLSIMTENTSAPIRFYTGGFSSSDERAIITQTGDIGIGTTTPYSHLTVWGPDTASTGAFLVANNASTTEFSVLDNGNATLAGTLTQSSDQRLKTNIQSLDASSSLAAIEALNPVSFNWVDDLFGSAEQLGFIAQAVQRIFPQLISTTSPTPLTPDGTLGLNYAGLIAPIVGAIQDIASISGNFESALVAWLGNAGNGIGDLFADNIHAEKELCIGTTCIDQAQLQSLLAETGQSGDADVSSPAASLSTTTPPSIQIMGEHPAVIEVGDQYADLGAIATDSQGHTLDIQTYVDGTIESPIVIDTSAPATDTIDYVATDSYGNTATSTRTIIVEAASSTVSAVGAEATSSAGGD